MAGITLSLHAKQPKRATLSYDRAYIEIFEYPRASEAVITWTEDGRKEVLREGDTKMALSYEVSDMEKTILTGEDAMYLSYSRDVMKIMTKLRQDWGHEISRGGVTRLRQRKLQEIQLSFSLEPEKERPDTRFHGNLAGERLPFLRRLQHDRTHRSSLRFCGDNQFSPGTAPYLHGNFLRILESEVLVSGSHSIFPIGNILPWLRAFSLVLRRKVRPILGNIRYGVRP